MALNNNASERRQRLAQGQHGARRQHKQARGGGCTFWLRERQSVGEDEGRDGSRENDRHGWSLQRGQVMWYKKGRSGAGSIGSSCPCAVLLRHSGEREVPTVFLLSVVASDETVQSGLILIDVYMRGEEGARGTEREALVKLGSAIAP